MRPPNGSKTTAMLIGLGLVLFLTIAGVMTGGAHALEDETTVIAQVDEHVRVLEFAYSDDEGVFSIALENTGDEVSRVTITEAIGPERAGAGSFTIETYRVSAGERIVAQVDAERSSGSAGVMITTQRSLAAGQGTFLQDREELTLFDGEATWGDVRAAVVFGMPSGALFALLGAWAYVSRKHKTVNLVDI